MDETSRLAALKLLDLLSVVNLDEDEPPPPRVYKMLARELAEIGAVSALIDSDGSSISAQVDITPLMTAASVIIETLISQVSAAFDQDRLTTINNARRVVNLSLGPLGEPDLGDF